jgi:hypothetical protein
LARFVGCIKPTSRPDGLEELIRMLPEGIAQWTRSVSSCMGLRMFLFVAAEHRKFARAADFGQRVQLCAKCGPDLLRFAAIGGGTLRQRRAKPRLVS